MTDFNDTSTVYITRISPTSASSAKKDYKTFLRDLRYDSDSRNRIQVSDYFGFIVDDDKTKIKKVKIHKVIRVGSVEQRHVTWNSNNPYNPNNGKQSPKDRKPIYLSEELMTFPWRWWKQTVKYAPNCAWWMPQGTIKSKNPLRSTAPDPLGRFAPGLKYAVEPGEEKSYLDKLLIDVEAPEDEKEYRETYFGYEEIPKEA